MTTPHPDQFEGMIAPEDVAFLSELARTAPPGAIVEIGAYRGKSAISLAAGAASRADNPPMIYSVEPHAEYVGVYGGRFGPHDRTAYYRNMLDAGCAEQVALINLRSARAALAWEEPIGLLFIDGDHSLEGVRADAAAWLPHLVVGGIVAFDDAFDPSIGPYPIVAALVADGGYERLGSTRKIAALRKRS